MLTGTLPPISNRATWRETVELRDEDDNLIDLVTDVSAITINIRDTHADTVVLTGSLSDGAITVSNLSDGIFEFVFSAAAMGDLPARTYEIGCLITFSTNGDTEQVILGSQPVVRGL